MMSSTQIHSSINGGMPAATSHIRPPFSSYSSELRTGCDDDDSEVEGNTMTLEKQRPRNGRKRQTRKTFPFLLHELLADNDLQHVISWLPDGESFVIKSRELLVKEALIKYFKESKYLSFTRKLNRWGFKRTTSNIYPNDIVFFHRLFVKDAPDLCKGMSGAKKQSKKLDSLRRLSNVYSASTDRNGHENIVRSAPQLILPPPSFHSSSGNIAADPVDQTIFSEYEAKASALLGRAGSHLEQVQALRMEMDATHSAAAFFQAPVGVATMLQPPALEGIRDLRVPSSRSLFSLETNQDIATRLDLEALLIRRRQAERNDRFFRLIGRPYP